MSFGTGEHVPRFAARLHTWQVPLQAVLQHERAAAVREAIAKLPPKQRATLVLRIYQECSHEEIAAALGGTVGAAKANLFHALGNLRRALSVK